MLQNATSIKKLLSQYQKWNNVEIINIHVLAYSLYDSNESLNHFLNMLAELTTITLAVSSFLVTTIQF